MESKCSELGAFEEAEMVVDRKPTRLRKPLQGHADRDRALTEDVFDFGFTNFIAEPERHVPVRKQGTDFHLQSGMPG